MLNKVSDEQIEAYQRDGFLVIENFLSPEELERWRESVGEAVRQRLESSGSMLTNQEGDDYYRNVFTQCLRLADTHVGVRKLMYDPQIGEVAAKLAKVSGIRVWHDQALIKGPYGNPTAWHLDNPYWSFTSPDALSIWIALDDATLSNGCMHYIPGSHRLAGNVSVDIGPNLADLFKAFPDWLKIDPVACPCPAGSAVFHNGLTAHGAGANMTNRPRRAMTCAFMPDGSTFNGVQNILPTEYFQSLKVGDPLNDSTQNPLIWPA